MQASPTIAIHGIHVTEPLKQKFHCNIVVLRNSLV